MAIIPRHIVKFRELKIGDHFKFANDVMDRYASGWHRTAKKISSRCYVYADKHAYMRAGVLKTCVGTTSVNVEFTGRRSPVKRRRGRGRGPGKLAGYRRRR